MSKNNIKVTYNQDNNSTGKVSVDSFSKEVIKEVREFHQSFSQYEVTPLHTLNNLAEEFKLDKIWVKVVLSLWFKCF